ncbi:MAG TPA: pitrilysin family protein [Luteibaculaceae bacterium]|nr:pitrilysin family protein [Luteibaculaceae bacterium]
MNKQTWLLALLLCSSGGAAFSQAKLIEKVGKSSTGISIPYEKYVLPNGLTVVVHEDHSDPIVHVDVTYHVGSAREEIGKSGFAHFFEHMMFQGSDHVADDEHFKIVSESGGTLNGTTNRDRTNYFETLPANQLETALWLEADRMGFLLDAVTQVKFENQRETVKNERGQNYDNRPYGLASEYLSKTLYPYGHPYSWLTIGYIEDLNRVDVNDLKNFFLRWYGPNNATLTVGGDVTTAEVVKLAEKYFGSIPKGPEVKAMKLPAPVLPSDRYVHYEDNVKLPMIQMAFPGVPQGHPDEAALDCLADIIGGGKYSILYKNLVKTQKALQAYASDGTSELAGEFTLVALASPGSKLSDIEKIIREGLLEFEKNGPSDEDIKRFTQSTEANFINRFTSVAGKVSSLASNQTFYGNPGRTSEELKRYLAVTKADVIRVYNQYIKGKNAVILSVVPKGKADLIAAADNFKVSEAGYKPGKNEYAGLKYAKATDNFDRSKRPAAGPNPVVKVPEIWTEKWSNGITVAGTVSDEVPTVSIFLSIPGGRRLESDNLSKAGIASLMSSLLNESTENYTSEQLSSELDKLGSRVSISADGDNLNLSIECLVKNLDRTLVLAQEKLFKPKFAQEEFDRLKNQQLQAISNQATSATAIANAVYAKLLFGSENVAGIPSIGTEESVKSITLDDIKAFYKKSLSPDGGNLVVVGDIKKDAILAKLAPLKSWKGEKTTLTEDKTYPEIKETTIYFVDKENAPQSEIRIGFPSIKYDGLGDYYRSFLMNFPLGGAFSSRINLNLRENKGWTYGARSGFSGNKYNGLFTASAGVKGNATDSAVVEFMKEINGYRNAGISSEELTFVKSSIGQQDARNYETPRQKAGFISRIVDYNLPLDYTVKQSEILRTISKTEVDALAKKLIKDKMVIVVVGDKKSVLPGLQKLGYPVVELKKDGSPL